MFYLRLDEHLFALDWFSSLAIKGKLAIVPEVDRAYPGSKDAMVWRVRNMRRHYGPQAGERALWDCYFNAGVFALPANAPHWGRWADHFARGLAATDGKFCCDQTALNHAIWMEGLPVSPLPVLCNWLCHLSVPLYEPVKKRFFEPLPPMRSIGILHLTANSKDIGLKQQDKKQSVPAAVGLRFPGFDGNSGLLELVGSGVW